MRYALRMQTEMRVLGEADRPAAERFLKQQPSGIALAAT